MTTITELKNMLEILNIDTLNQLNTSIIHEEPYSWGRPPLLIRPRSLGRLCCCDLSARHRPS